MSKLFRKRFVIWLNANGILKITLSSFLVILVLFIFSYELPATKTWTYWTMPLSGKVIALDAGHGGPDGGAESADGGIIEKDINLAICMYLRDYLQQAGAVVVMTREDDTDLAKQSTKGFSRRKTEDLLTRVEMIQKNKADMLVSVHLNSISSAKWSGAQTFYQSKNQEGRSLATFIQEELRNSLQNTDRQPLPRDSFYLLKVLKIPSSLVEVGFLSNPEEARMMANATYQKKLAEAIYRGILRYSSGEKLKTSSLSISL